MTDDTNKDDVETEPQDALTKGLRQVAERIDQERFPGVAWTMSKAKPLRQRRVPRFLAPVATLAAGIALAVLLLHRPTPTAPRNGGLGPFVALSSQTGSTQPGYRRARSTFLDPAVLGQVRLSAPDVNLPAGSAVLPLAGSGLTGPDSYTWDIPEIHVSTL